MTSLKFNDYAKDINLNLRSVLSEEGSSGLNRNQIYGIALASAFSTKNDTVVKALLTDIEALLTEQEIFAAKIASSLMAMNNVYYRFTHLVEDGDFMSLPAKLRMNALANPGIDKSDFELYSLAVSAINGCGLCMKSHSQSLLKLGVSKQTIQSSVRIASVINAASQSAYIDNLNQ